MLFPQPRRQQFNLRVRMESNTRKELIQIKRRLWGLLERWQKFG